MNIIGATITGSLILNGVNISSVTGSESSINALNSFTASAATTGSNQFNGNQTVTGSVNITGSLIVTGSIIGTVTTASYVLNAVSASYALVATTSSYALVATSASYALNATTSSFALVATTASYAANADLLDGRDSLTFANTGSNAFVGTQNINGDVAITGSLTTTGAITAQTLNVQQVTSSIVYSSGSNIFGNSVSNTQSMTGSVGISGSLAVVGTGTFSGNVSLGASYLYMPTAFSGTEVAGSIYKRASDGLVLFSAVGTTNDFTLYNSAGSTVMTVTTGTVNTRLYGALSGSSATFSDVVSLAYASTQTAEPSGGVFYSLQNTSNTNNNWSTIRFKDAQGNDAGYVGVQHVDHTNNRGDVVILARPSGGNITEVARFLGTGATTLAGALTGTSATFNTATISGAVTTAINSQPVTTTHYINHRLGNGYVTGRGTTGETFISSNTDLFTATITAASSYLSQNAGNLLFFNAPSVTAGSTPTFTQQFTIAASGAATFSSSVTVGTDIVLSAANPFVYGGTSVGGVGMSNVSGSSYMKIYAASHATSANVTQFVNAGSTSLSIASTGAATFSSSVNVKTILSLGTGSGKFLGVGSDISGAFSSTDFVLYNTGGDLKLLSTGAVGVTIAASTGAATFSGIAVAQLFSGENSTSSSAVIQAWNKATSGDNKFIEFYVDSGGGTLRGSIDFLRSSTLTRYNTTSDANLKNIIGDSNKQKSIDILNSTKIREFSWKADETNKPQIGVIAQELYETYKGAVSVGSDEELLGTEEYKNWQVDKTAFTFHLIAGFQEHERIIQELKAEIDLLKGEPIIPTDNNLE